MGIIRYAFIPLFFLILSLLAWRVFKKSSKAGLAGGFGSVRLRLIVLVGLGFFVVGILSIGWFSLNRIQSGVLKDVGKKLTGTLVIAEKGLHLWEAERKAFVRQLGHDPKLVALTERLLQVSPHRKALETSEVLRKVRNYFIKNKDIFPNIGFFIINSQNISIGTTRDINLGTTNLIYRQHPELITQAFRGQVGFVPPMESDIQLNNVSKSDSKKPPTMFFVGPIQKPDGKIIAVMTLRVDPSKDLSRIMGIVGGLGTEETYAFTREGRLISDSKFDEQLHDIGLIGVGQKAVMNIEIRDPGGNMVKGYRPEMERSRQPLTRLAAAAMKLQSRMKAAGAHYGQSEIEMDMDGYRDYRGVFVFGAWVWDANLDLGIGTEIDVDEALLSYYRIRVIILVLLGLTIFLFVGGTLFILRMGERTNSALTRAKDELEDKVLERTRELKESEERFALTTSGSGDGLWDFDLPDEFFWYSSRFRELLGYSSEEDYPNQLESWSDGLHPDDRDATLDAFTAHLERAKPYDVEYRLKTKKGEWRWFRARGKSLRDENGRSYRAAGSITDINEAKQTEAELRKLSQAVEQSPASVVITDLEGTISYVNSKFCQVTGYTVQEAVGANPRVLKSGDMPSEIYEDLWNTISAGREWRGELLNKKKNGELYWETASISPITSADGVITHYLAVKEDITARKRMEEELRSRITELDEAHSTMLKMMNDLDEEKQKAEEATQAKSDFLANMSHEIRTPMNAILGMSHLALNTDLNHKQRDYVNKIQSSANALLGIINDILDFSKIEAGKLDMEEINFSLDDVLENVSNLIGVKSQEKGLELLFDTGREAPLYLVGDPLRLGQVLTNLGNNAVKFTEKGEIVIRTELVEKKENKVQLRFTVKDSGIGLTEEQQGKLFHAFSQADTTTTRKYGGTGLGLTISRRLVNLMGGDIHVKSIYGEGSSFIFTVSLGLAQLKEEPVLIPGPDLRGMRVLVVDDNNTSQDIFKGLLASMSFEVTLAASAEEGLKELEMATAKEPIELVLMDWQMPGMDGLKASTMIKAHPEQYGTPRIIMVTAYGREEIMKQAEKVGLEGFLLKPVTPSLLFDTIMAAFGKDVFEEKKAVRGEEMAAGLKSIQGAKVLLVEDNEINQQVAREILEGAGLVVDIADDGQKGLESVQRNTYDLVLMDIQMPVMDGYTASREIRKWEQFGNSQSAIPIPIVAMTANAMAGDREKALDAGMNEHVAKPIHVKSLFSVLLKFIRAGTRELPEPMAVSGEGVCEKEAPPLPELAGIDSEDGLARVGGNRGFYRKILMKFRAGNLGVMAKIQKEVVRKDFEAAEQMVHAVKGASGNIGATDLFESAQNLDDALKQKKTEGLDVLVDEFSSALEVTLASIVELASLEEKSSDAISVKPMDMNRVKEIMNRLKELLEDDDAEAANVLDSLKEHPQVPEAQQHLRKLAAHVAGYDFEEAIGSLSELARTMKIDL